MTGHLTSRHKSSSEKQRQQNKMGDPGAGVKNYLFRKASSEGEARSGKHVVTCDEKREILGCQRAEKGQGREGDKGC